MANEKMAVEWLIEYLENDHEVNLSSECYKDFEIAKKLQLKQNMLSYKKGYEKGQLLKDSEYDIIRNRQSVTK